MIAKGRMRASLVGIGRPSVVVDSLVELARGSRRYELSDWLGNVRVVVSDARVPVRQGGQLRGYRAEVVGSRDYYSYGQDIGERSYSLVDAYRYSFNGKEDIGEQRWWQDYGARLYHRGLGRFMRADPLIVGGKRYAWLSGYQFASASPVWAVDRDGLEAFIVHGTLQDRPSFSSEVIKELQRIAGNSAKDDKFSWGGRMTWSAEDRTPHAEELKKYVIQRRAELLQQGAITAGEPITLIGYSHGGNIAIQAARMLGEHYKSLGEDVKLQLITVSTPAYNSEGGPENPADLLASGILSWHLHIVHEGDIVGWLAGGGRTHSPSESRVNLVVSEESVPILIPGWDAHVKIQWSEKFAQWLNRVPQMEELLRRHSFNLYEYPKLDREIGGKGAGIRDATRVRIDIPSLLNK